MTELSISQHPPACPSQSFTLFPGTAHFHWTQTLPQAAGFFTSVFPYYVAADAHPCATFVGKVFVLSLSPLENAGFVGAAGEQNIQPAGMLRELLRAVHLQGTHKRGLQGSSITSFTANKQTCAICSHLLCSL